MKNLPAALLTFLQSNNKFGRADLFKITLINGQSIAAATSQVNFNYGPDIYYPTKYGIWERGPITTEAGFSLKASDVTLTMKVNASVVFPGTTISMMQCVAAGFFDGAAVTIYTAYWPDGSTPNTDLGVETKFVGQILNFSQSGRSLVTFRVADLLYLLNLKTPPKLIQAGCRHVFGGVNCGFDLSTVTSTNSVAFGSTTQVIVLNSAVAANVFAQGYVTFTSGQNFGLTIAIKSQQSTTQITLAGKTPLPLGVGDTFTITQGCNKTQARCNTLFGSSFNLHYGGQDYVPSPEMAI